MRFICLALLSAAALFAAEPPSPGFKIRGALPWHIFSGPTAWDEKDYEQYLDWMKKSGLNLLSLHCYTGGLQRYVNYVEPMIRIEYRDVVPEAAFDTSITARWGYRPLAVRDFAFGTGKLFQLPAGARAFGSQAALLARNNEERYQRAQALIGHVITMAHARGIQVAMGFEFGVYPPELLSVIPQESYSRSRQVPDPTHPASLEILHGTIENVLKAYPRIDWIWLWLQEHSSVESKPADSPGFQSLTRRDAALFGTGVNESTVFNGVWSLAYIRAAHAYLARRAPKVRLAISGWGGGNQIVGILGGLHKALPREIVFTCLNPSQGQAAQPAVFAEIAKTREAWIIPWLEGDAKLWHPQPRVSYLRDQIQLAKKQGVQGVVAIHWRTEDIRANMSAFARFAQHPERAPSLQAFYTEDATAQYGVSAAKDLAPLLARMDSEHWFEALKSPEYFPYDPTWGRMKPDLRTRLNEAMELTNKLAGTAKLQRERANLQWLAATFRFTLLLDDVSRGIEPAYKLKEQWLRHGRDVPNLAAQIAQCRTALNAVPIEALFQTYASRVRSRGELGVLSALNQRVWLQYQELRNFLNSKLQYYAVP